MAAATQPALVPAAEEKTGFFDLPPELRNRIYDLVAHDGHFVFAIWQSKRSTGLSIVPPTQLQQVARQFRQEFVPRYWRGKHITLFDTDQNARGWRQTELWLKDFGSQAIPHARSFFIWTRLPFTISLGRTIADKRVKAVTVRHELKDASEEQLQMYQDVQKYAEDILQEHEGWVFLTVETITKIAAYAVKRILEYGL